jgi:hypothetical protein
LALAEKIIEAGEKYLPMLYQYRAHQQATAPQAKPRRYAPKRE